MDFGQPDAEIGQKMANGRLLFLALVGGRGLQSVIIPIKLFKAHPSPHEYHSDYFEKET